MKKQIKPILFISLFLYRWSESIVHRKESFHLHTVLFSNYSGMSYFSLDDHMIKMGITAVLCYSTTETSHQNLNQNFLINNHKLGNYFSKASFQCLQCSYKSNSYTDMSTVVFTKIYAAKSKTVLRFYFKRNVKCKHTGHDWKWEDFYKGLLFKFLSK